MVGVNIVLWLLLLVWIMLPGAVGGRNVAAAAPLMASCRSSRHSLSLWLQSYQMIWLSSLAVAAVFLVGIKLQSIIICLAQGAYQLYGSRSGMLEANAGQSGFCQAIPLSICHLQCTTAHRVCCKA